MARDLEGKWKQIGDRHAAAVEGFLGAAAAVDASGWQSPLADGKWTPAQVTQHLIQTYEVLVAQVRTGKGLKVQTGWLLRQVLRQVVLRHIMRTRRLPRGAKAPRALLPADADASQGAAIERLRAAAAEFEAELLARRDEPSLQLTHHIFGSVGALEGLDFVAIHTEHHGRQIAAPQTARAGNGAEP
jgi:hypothetical protein